MEPKKIIIDCDAGTDDAVALIILLAAHKEKKVDVRAITCVGGNTSVDNVVRNVYRTLRICGATDIPVYRGACTALLKTEGSKKAQEDTYHGRDGLGDVFTDEEDTSKLRSEHAVMALHGIVAENAGQVSLVCLAPLTNVALTIKMFPDFLDRLEELYVMGGNSTGKGNITAQAEFNFFADPESAHIVLNSNEKPLFLLPWETCLTSEIPMKWRHDVLGKMDNPIVGFINAIESKSYPETLATPYRPCDGLLAAMVVRPEIVRVQEDFHADIELNGSRTRGQVVLDHLSTRKPNVRLITAYHSEIFKEIMLWAVEQS